MTGPVANPTMTNTHALCPDLETSPPVAGCPTTSIPGFERGVGGKPLIPPTNEAVFAYADLVRRTERLILNLFGRGLVSGTTHTCIGQEICQIGIVRALTHEDSVLSTHRNHGHFLTYTGDFLGLTAEVMGRQAGVCGGRGGSQHLAVGHFHSNGVQGGMTAIGVGLSLSRKWRHSDRIVGIMIGDGTLGEGLLYESLNLASIWSVPALFVVENNGIAQTTPTRETIAGDIQARASAFGIQAWQLDDADPDFLDQCEEIVGIVRRTGRPGLTVIETRRLGPHSKGDDLRPSDEMEEIRRRDPLEALGRSLPSGLRREIEERNEVFLQGVEAAAAASPAACDRRLARPLFKTIQRQAEPRIESQKRGNVRGSLNQSLRRLLELDRSVILLGEDLHDPYGGAFKVTAGLSTDFPGRVLSTPISEAGVVGAAIGLALAGFRPIVEIMFADFLTLCLDQIYNHAVKFPLLFEGMDLPLMIRTPTGGRRGYGPTHSQCPENLMVSVPGLTVVAGSHRHDNGQLLEHACLYSTSPVLFLEHKQLYSESESCDQYIVLNSGSDVPPENRLFPTLVRPRLDPDLTILTYSGMLPYVEKAAAELEEQEELSVEIVVPSLLSPFPNRTIVPALVGRRRVLIAEEAHAEYGFGAEVLAQLVEAGFHGRALRVATPMVPIPSARSLELEILPDQESIVRAAIRLL